MNSRLAQKLSLEGNWNFENSLSVKVLSSNVP